MKTYGSKNRKQTRRRTIVFPVSHGQPLGENHNLNIQDEDDSRIVSSEFEKENHEAVVIISSSSDSESGNAENSPTSRRTLKRSLREPRLSSSYIISDNSDEEEETIMKSHRKKQKVANCAKGPSVMSDIKRKRRKTDPGPQTTGSKMVQTRLALVDEFQTTCKECGMSFMPTYSLDVKLHAKFHAKSVDGRDWSLDWGSLVKFPAHVAKVIEGYIVVKVTPSSRVAAKKATQDMIHLVNTELSAPPENPTWKNGPAGAGAAYLYVCKKNKKAVGVLVVERVSRGRPMVVSTSEILPPDTMAIHARLPVVMGVSRIFTVRNYRRMGISTALLDIARYDFIFGLRSQKLQVAWSQPSASGAKLALRWAPITLKPAEKQDSSKSLLSPPPSSPAIDSNKQDDDLASPRLAILTYLERDAIVR
jgi:N-acetyltransferase